VFLDSKTFHDITRYPCQLELSSMEALQCLYSNQNGMWTATVDNILEGPWCFIIMLSLLGTFTPWSNFRTTVTLEICIVSYLCNQQPTLEVMNGLIWKYSSPNIVTQITHMYASINLRLRWCYTVRHIYTFVVPTMNHNYGSWKHLNKYGYRCMQTYIFNCCLFLCIIITLSVQGSYGCSFLYVGV